MNKQKSEHARKLTFWRFVFLSFFFLYFINNLILYFLVAENLSLISISGLLAIKLFPLMLFIPSVIKPNFKLAIAFCCLLLFYFSFTAIAMLQEGNRSLLAMSEGIIFAALFWSAYKLGKLH